MSTHDRTCPRCLVTSGHSLTCIQEGCGGPPLHELVHDRLRRVSDERDALRAERDALAWAVIAAHAEMVRCEAHWRARAVNSYGSVRPYECGKCDGLGGAAQVLENLLHEEEP